MLNRIIIMGRLVRDPELRSTQSGLAVTSFTLAVDRDFKDKQSGEKAVDFIDVVAWRSTAEFVCKYFSKGRMAVVEGRLQIRDWNDRDGNKRRSAEVVADSVYFGDSKRDNHSSGDGYGPPPYGVPAQSGSGYNRGYGGGPSTGGAPPPQSSPYPPSDYGGQGFQDIEDDDGDLPF